MYLIIAVLLVFFGEALSMVAELIAAQRMQTDGIVFAFFTMLVLIAVAGALLIAGYMMGYAQFKNIWIVAAISVGSVVIVEPVLTYILFQQYPTTGAAIGIVLGFLGILTSLFVR